MQAVNVTKLCHSYSGGTETPILDDLSLTLNQGETLALVGASGSGKSTLLNLIGGLETLQSGDIQIFDESLAHADEATRTRLRRGTIGFVYQSFNLIPTLNVIDNIRLPLALAGRTHAQQQGRWPMNRA